MTSAVQPPVYDGRSALDRWLDRFEICAKANGWDEAAQGCKLPAFLEGEALAVYLQMPKGDHTLKEVKAALEAAFAPPEGRGEHLRAFNSLSWREGESPRNFMFELRRLLDLAMPGLESEAREQLLYHQFVNGLPEEIGMAIRTSRDCGTTDAAVGRALLLTAARKARPSAVAAVIDDAARAATNDAAALAFRIDQLERELLRLRSGGDSDDPAADGAVAAVTLSRPKKRRGFGRSTATHTLGGGGQETPKGPRCWACKGFGHIARQCANNAVAQNNDEEPSRTLQQGNERGAAAVRGAAGRF